MERTAGSSVHKNGRTVKRHAVQEVDKRTLEPVEVVTIGFHVVGIDVGHHRHHRQQVQERRVGLIGLHHDVIALPQTRIGTGAVESPANHKRRVQTGFSQHAGDQAGGGGFAVGAGDGDALFEAHQLSQHQSAWHHRNAILAGVITSGLVGLHGGGGHHRIGTDDVAAFMADKGLMPNAQPLSVALSDRSEPEMV
jgi:hypothetical protein